MLHQNSLFRHGILHRHLFLLYVIRPQHPHTSHVNHRIIPYCRILPPCLTLQNNPVNFLEILRHNHVLFRIKQPVINGRGHIVHRSLPNPRTPAVLIKEQIQIKFALSLHMQPFAMNTQSAVLILLFYFNKSHITQSFSLFIFIQITNKTLQLSTSNPGLFITIYSPG